MIWEVRITGDKSDLEELSKILTSKDLSIVKENEHFILKSEDFDILSDYGEVKTKTNELLNTVNAIAQLTLDSREIIKYNHIFQLDEYKITGMCLESKIGVFSRVYIRKIFPYDETEIYNPIRNCKKLAEKDKNVKDVFDLIVFNFDSWYTLYKIFETLRKDELFVEVLKEGNYSKKAKLLKQTANHYRHADNEKHPLPPNVITLSEAKSFTKLVLLKWLAQK